MSRSGVRASVARPGGTRKAACLALAGSLVAAGLVGVLDGPAAGSTTVAAAAVQSRATQLRFGASLRAQWGLADDTKTLDNLATRTDLVADPVGTLVTPQEHADLARRFTVAARLPAVIDAAAARFGARFAGIYVDQSAGGTVVVRTTDAAGLAADSAAVKALLPPGTPVSVRPARFSVADLDRTVGGIQAALPSLLGEHILVTSYGISPTDNSVHLAVSPSSPATSESVLAAKFGGAVVVRREAPKFAPLTRRFNNPRIGGGQLIDSTINKTGGYYECTAGFGAKSNTSANYYIVTAGHCGRFMWRVGYPTGTKNILGGVVNDLWQWSTDQNAIPVIPCDCMAIGPNKATRVTNALYNGPKITSTETQAQAYVGEAVSASLGESNAIHTGQVTDINQTFLTGSSGPVPTYTYVSNAGFATITAIEGDSGSPIYSGTRAVGMLSSIASDGTTTQIGYTQAWAVEKYEAHILTVTP